MCVLKFRTTLLLLLCKFCNFKRIELRFFLFALLCLLVLIFLLRLIQLLLLIFKTIFPPILVSEDGNSFPSYYFVERALPLVEDFRQVICFCELNVHIHTFLHLAEGLTVGIKAAAALDR